MEGVDLRNVLNASPQLINDLKTLDIDQDVTRRLSLLMLRTLTGDNSVLVTPIGKKYGPDVILNDFDKLFNSKISFLNETLQNLEFSNKAAFGPRSIAIPWSMRKHSLFSSFESENISNVTPLTSPGNRRLRPVSVEVAVANLKNNTNSGLPFYKRKGLIKGKVLNEFDDLLRRRDPCILFTRTQESNKTRNVWGYPVADTVNEMRFYLPFLAYQRRLTYRSAIIGPEEVGRRVTNIILNSIKRKKTIISIDFSKYDNTVKAKTQNVAFDYIKSCFQANFSTEIDYISERFGSIPIVTPSGVIKGSHGVPSGSTFTNEVDSIVQANIGLSFPFITESDFQVQGDDGVYSVPEDYVSDFVNRFESNGLAVNRDKSYVSNDFAIYLQNLYHIDYMKDGLIGGIYPLYRALNRIIYQERWSDFEVYGISGKDYYSIRTICIMENCKHHPLFKEFVNFILKYDKYSLDPSDQGIKKFVHMQNDAQSAGEALNHQYGSKAIGIENFAAFKMIKELS